MLVSVGIICRHVGRWGRLNAGGVAENWRLPAQNVVDLVQSQVYHPERLPYLFAARSP